MRTVICHRRRPHVQDVIDVARGGLPAPNSAPMCRHHGVQPLASWPPDPGDTPVYGVTPGFGALADRRSPSRRLAGCSAPSSARTPRAPGTPRRRHRPRDPPAAGPDAGRGYSGVRPDLPRRSRELLSLGLLPVVPSKGSVGASGDWPSSPTWPSRDRRGPLRRPGRPSRRPAQRRGARGHGLERSSWPQGSLSLVNGTEPMQALLAFSVYDAADAGPGGRHCLRPVRSRRCWAPTGPRRAVRPCGPTRGSWTRGQPAGPAGGSPLAGQPPHSRHAVQDAYCLAAPAGARRGPGRAGPRRPGHRHRAGRGGGQPDRVVADG